MNSEAEDFLRALQAEAQSFTEAVATKSGDWIIKGFIDIFKRIYTISVDTKLVSKVLELLLIPKLMDFGHRNGYKIVLAPQQNFYPDLSFISIQSGSKFAVDIKSTYRKDTQAVNGMTLGAFTGYFRNRISTKNTTFAYQEYLAHIVLGVIYSQTADVIDERQIYTLDDLASISSVIRDFIFFAQPKYRIASSRPGSGNTKNIGSVTSIDQLLEGTGPFTELGEDIYDDYWEHYLTDDMAKKLDIPRPYSNLKTYLEYKRLGSRLTDEIVEKAELLDTGPTQEENA